MSDIQRYNPKFESSGPFNSVVWVSSGEGVVCMYSDHIADRKADRERIAELEGTLLNIADIGSPKGDQE